MHGKEPSETRHEGQLCLVGDGSMQNSRQATYLTKDKEGLLASLLFPVLLSSFSLSPLCASRM